MRPARLRGHGRHILATLALFSIATGPLLTSVVPAAHAEPGDGTLTVSVLRTFTESASYTAELDRPQSDMAVTVTDAAGESVAGTTDATGQFVLDSSSTLTGGKYRVEVAIPTSMEYLQPAFAKLGGAYDSFISFVDVSGGTDVLVRTAVWNPSDYQQVDPPLAVPLQSIGAEPRALVRWESTARGRDVATTTVQTQAEVGTVYGTAYDPVSERLFSGAFAKRHTPYGSGGPGAIYVSPASGGGATLFATVPNAGTTAHTGTPIQDLAFFDIPGTEALGDLELSEDRSRLYTVNLFTKELVIFDATGATAAAPLSTVTIPDPGCANGQWRPMGLGVRDGKLYVGGVCDASDGTRADLRAVVYEYDGASFTTIVSNPLDQLRGAVAENPGAISTHWNPWVSTYLISNSDATASGQARPMPELSDIAFDRDGSMILGFRDRHGDQLGFNAHDPGGFWLVKAVSGGDTVKVCRTASGYVWEGSSECPGNNIPGYTGNQPTGASGVNEFFVGETVYLDIHREPTMGTVATLLRTNDVVTTAYDPMNVAYTSGVMYLSLLDGTGPYTMGGRGGSRGAEFLNALTNPWGKGNGLGDLSLLVEPAPIQIGNVVWFDADGDGIQGADEPPLAGVTVNLIRNGEVIGTRITDARGEYYFSSLDSDLNGEFVPLGGDYEIEFVVPTTGQITIPGSGTHDWSELLLTEQAAGSNTDIDSTPNPVTRRTSYTAGQPGENDHSLDAGFMLAAPVPGYTHEKTSVPEAGSTIVGGDTIAYTVTGHNTGTTVLDPVVIEDDLSAVVNNAEQTGALVVMVLNSDDSEVPGAPDASITEEVLSWTGSLLPGQRVEITYTVTIDADVAAGVIVTNLLSSSATPPDASPITPTDVVLEHPVPGFSHSKVSDPVAGSTVLGGDTIGYTVTGINTGATALDPVVITDDLSAVLTNATLDDDPVVHVYNSDNSEVATPPAADVTGTTLSWNGALDQGQRVVISYTVTLNDEVAAGVVLNNHLSSSATPPGTPAITPPDVNVDHPVPGYVHAKSSDPVSGTTVVGNDTITYTLTGNNIGATVLDTVVITDDLSAVLPNATITTAAVVSVYDSANSVVSGPTAIPLTGTTLSWSGTLQPGERAVISYTVTLAANVAAGTIVENHLSSSATPPGTPAIVPTDVVLAHPVPGYLHSKTSNPAQGSTVVGGDTITYTLTGNNIGATVLDPVTIIDDYSDVISNAVMDSPPEVNFYDADDFETVGGAQSLTNSGTILTWSGSLQPGQRVEIVYTVTVNAGVAPGTILENLLSSSATPPGTPAITPPDVAIAHPVPGYVHSKTSDPVAGSTVIGGDTITYTVTGRNTGATVLNSVTITDDLIAVLPSAELTTTAVAKVYDKDDEEVPGAPAVVLTGTVLSWTGILQPGERVEMVYTVTIDAEVSPGTIVENHLSSSATPPGKPAIVPTDVVIEHPVPGYTHSKTSDPVAGSTVTGGDTITYTVTGSNAGATVLDPVVITDDLSDVLSNAAMTGPIEVHVYDADDGEIADGPAADLTGTTLSWTGVLQPGEWVEIVYTVTIDTDVAPGIVVENHLSSTATPPGKPAITPTDVIIGHPTPGFELLKASTPGSGSAVAAGDTVSYTVTGRNTGGTVLNPVTISDDLSGVLDHAAMVGNPVVSVYNADDTPQAGPANATVSNGVLNWSGVLQAGQRVEILYTVTVDAAVAPATTLRNTVSGQATPAGAPPITPPPATTEHPVASYTISKSSTPPSGSLVRAGDEINYLITVSNTGATALDPVTVTDDLARVLDKATMVGSPTSSAGATPALSGRTLSWTGSLAVGGSVLISYTVLLDSTIADGAKIDNIATSSATPPDHDPLHEPAAVTTHQVPQPPLAFTGLGPIGVPVLVALLLLAAGLALRFTTVRRASIRRP